MKFVDDKLMFVMKAVVGLLPDFRQFSNIDYVAHGFNTPGDTVLAQACRVLGYSAAAFLIGFCFLRSREVAK